MCVKKKRKEMDGKNKSKRNELHFVIELREGNVENFLLSFTLIIKRSKQKGDRKSMPKARGKYFILTGGGF